MIRQLITKSQTSLLVGCLNPRPISITIRHFLDLPPTVTNFAFFISNFKH
jgi:hypothetical protein